jgi:hypothetical protein
VTEHDWLTSESPEPMLLLVQSGQAGRRVFKLSARQLDLFSWACRRLTADTPDWLAEIDRHEDAVDDPGGGRALTGVGASTSPVAMAHWLVGYGAPRDKAARADLLRDIFGNPFRPARLLDGAWLRWRDCTVPRMASGIYCDRRWADLPILADALLDAGCDDDDLLDHLRGPGPHTRGCWALDLILGKS